ncbi:hypothetical protein CBR_g8205 [Chara braunii]|uniref:Reverse transcriptase domain-containing protein n=1 Tax=Chara braunii TaxID=69332 RepID=A0A388KLH4_CHABU|nr:hypothetical protein CBR_g8205 [Chara braunii]|eukprot:GBG70904.1 hypothetical protein CBR_g8205 [Chara braunii]
MATIHDVQVSDLYKKVSWEDMTKEWKKRFIVDDAPTLAINRIFTMAQGSTPTRDWLTDWQKIVATPDLDLPFPHLRREFYNRSCAALSLALGDREQYNTFAKIINKAREIIKTNRAAAHEKSTWQPTYVEKDFMVRAGLDPRVRRKSQPTQVTLADGHTHKSIDRCIDNVPVYFAPHASEAVSFDIPDTKFDMILGMSWLRSEDHPVNFFHRTVHIRDRNGVLVPCTVPLPHPSISCHVVSAASMRASIIRDDIEEMGVCFLHALPPHDASSTDSPLDPRITELLNAYSDVFEGPHGVVPDRPIRHKIILEDGAVPPRGCIYRMSEEELSVLRAHSTTFWRKAGFGLVHRHTVLLFSLSERRTRICGCASIIASSMRRRSETPALSHASTIFSSDWAALDLKSGYHQLEIRKEDRYKTAFKTRYGHFEWLVMPFGLTNAPTTFQAAMTTEFRHMLDRYVLIYLDDILVYNRSLEEHVEHLRTVLERLRQAKYKTNRDKCEFARQELEYLGHYVTPQGIRPLADKIEALRVWPEPTNTTDVRSFMGLAGYYQRFITGYSRIAAPMTRLQSPKVPFVFDDDARRSFQALKTTMLMAPVLSIYDPTLPTRVTTDASGYGIGAVLEQHDGDDWHPVEYFSHKVPPINSLDDARKKELLAFVMALKRWRHFLLGRRRFTWVTDNNPLTYYKTQDTHDAAQTLAVHQGCGQRQEGEAARWHCMPDMLIWRHLWSSWHADVALHMVFMACGYGAASGLRGMLTWRCLWSSWHADVALPLVYMAC